MKSGNRDVNHGENEMKGQHCDCVLCQVDGENEYSALRLWGWEGDVQWEPDPMFQCTQIHKLQWEAWLQRNWRSTHLAFFQDTGSSLLSSVYHLFNVGFLLLTPLHPSAQFQLATCQEQLPEACFFRLWGLHPADLVRTHMAFSENQSSVSMETCSLRGGVGGLRSW